MNNTDPVDRSADPTTSLAFSYGGPLVSGVIRAVPEDFYVNEILGFEPSGEGEHVFLQIEKRGLTTFAIRDKIAKLASCRHMDVGYSGLKDKWAITRQWFSVYLPGAEGPDWSKLAESHREDDSLTVARSSLKLLKVVRNNKKLRRGTHKANAFKLLVTQCSGLDDNSKLALDNRMQVIRKKGVPNYFGAQRFGRQGSTLKQARDMFANKKRMARDQRGLCLSAARSQLFNKLLSLRVAGQSWCEYLEGDVLILAGSRSQFTLDASDIDDPDGLAEIARRIYEGDLSVAGPLYGRGGQPDSSVAGQLEQRVFEQESVLAEGLVASDVDASRRPLRIIPEQLKWQISSEKCHLSFVLPTGSYATILLRELIECGA